MENPETRSEAEHRETAEPARSESQPETERTETAEAAATESQRLADATFEPEAAVQQTSGFQQAEAIETAFVQAVEQTAGAGEGAGARLPLPAAREGRGGEGSIAVAPAPAARGEEVSNIPLPLPYPQAGSGADQVSAMPIPLPGPELGLGEVSATPITLPTEAPDRVVDVVSATPIPLPDPVREAEGLTVAPAEGGPEEILAEGIIGPAPRAEEVRRDQEAHFPDGAASASSDEPLGITPINLPGVTQTAEGGVVGGREQLEAIPINIPYPRPEGQATAARAEMPGVEGGTEQVGAMPDPIPYPAAEREVGALPDPIPYPVAEREVGAMPDSIPYPAAEREVGALPDPIPYPVAEGEAEVSGAVAGEGEQVEGAASQAGDMRPVRGPTPHPLDTSGAAEGVEQAGYQFSEGGLPAPAQETGGRTGNEFAEAGRGSVLDRTDSQAGLLEDEIGDAAFAMHPPRERLAPAEETGEAADSSSGGEPSSSRQAGEPLAAVEPVTGELYGTPTSESQGTGEAGEQGTPPDWYVNVGPDGKITVVDKDGNPVDSPPNIQLYNPDGSTGTPHASYPGGDGGTFDLPYYSGSLGGCSVVFGADGKPVVVDASGKPLAVQPNVQTMNPDGTQCDPKAYYSGGKDNPVDLPLFTPGLDNCSVNVGSDGKVTVVDGNGVPLSIQPTVQMYNPDGTACIPPKVYYNGQDDDYYATHYIPYGPDYRTEAQTLPFYSGSLEGCSVNTGADGKPVVVDASGKPLALQPNIQTQNPDGTPCLKASYSGNKDNPAELPLYAGSLDGCSVQIGADGKPVVVGADGKPLAVQPNVQLSNPDGSQGTPKAYYSGNQNQPIDLPLYCGSLEKCFVSIGADGKPTVVDASGKPLAVQPNVQLFNPDGSQGTPKAYYSGNKDQPVELPYYTGPPKSSAAK